MDIFDIIKQRRSIRNFSSKEISDSIIKDILYYGTLSPSAHNKQPWEFVVIKNKNIKDKIADLLIEEDMKDGKESSKTKTALVMREAPVLILVFNKYNDEHILFNTLSLGACIENMLLAAKGYGLGSLWIGNICKVDKEVCKLLNHKNTLVSAVALGYYEEEIKEPSRNLVDLITEWR